MKPLSTNTSRMPRSGIREIMDLAWATPGCIRLEVGQPDFPSPPHVIEAACKAAREGWTKYTPNSGIPELREAIARKFERKNGINASLDTITVTPGAVCAVSTSMLALVDPGDEVLIPDPGWPNYDMMALSQNAVPVHYPLHRGTFEPDMDALDRAITERTKVMLLNTPSNPTGAVLAEEVIRNILDLASRQDLYIISDEVYEEIIFEGEHVSIGRLDSEGRVLTVSGMSKAYSMTGWRIGYVHAPAPISEVITKIQEPYVSCSCGVSQKAAEAALNGPQDCVAEMVAAYKERRDAVLDVLRDNDLYTYTPRGAFYLLLDISGTGLDSYTFARTLLQDRKVAVAPGATFGEIGASYVRVSFAASKEDLVEGITRACAYIHELS